MVWYSKIPMLRCSIAGLPGYTRGHSILFDADRSFSSLGTSGAPWELPSSSHAGYTLWKTLAWHGISIERSTMFNGENYGKLSTSPFSMAMLKSLPEGIHGLVLQRPWGSHDLHNESYWLCRPGPTAGSCARVVFAGGLSTDWNGFWKAAATTYFIH